MGISILIVDDDKLLVEKLEETVNWSGIGIDMVFTANNIRQAQKRAYDLIAGIHFDGMQYRRDIGHRAANR